MMVGNGKKYFNGHKSGEFVFPPLSLTPELSLILTYHHSHFSAATLDFTSFHCGILEAATSFVACIWDFFVIRCYFFL